MITATINHWKDTVYELIPDDMPISRAFWHCQRLLDEAKKAKVKVNYHDVNLAAWQLVYDEDAGKAVLPLGGGLT